VRARFSDRYPAQRLEGVSLGYYTSSTLQPAIKDIVSPEARPATGPRPSTPGCWRCCAGGTRPSSSRAGGLAWPAAGGSGGRSTTRPGCWRPWRPGRRRWRGSLRDRPAQPSCGSLRPSSLGPGPTPATPRRRRWWRGRPAWPACPPASPARSSPSSGTVPTSRRPPPRSSGTI
jgi:hypothetical protein